MHKSTTIYQSYLLRLWQDSPHSNWRAAVQSIQNHETVHFADLDTLFAFLATQTTQPLSIERPQPQCSDAIAEPVRVHRM